MLEHPRLSGWGHPDPFTASSRQNVEQDRGAVVGSVAIGAMLMMDLGSRGRVGTKCI
jgi:hypothetical protein